MKTKEIRKSILEDDSLRLEAATESLEVFFAVYFSFYVQYPSAPFQKEMIQLITDQTVQLLALKGFRNCGKSTLGTTIFPIYSMVKNQTKYILIIGKTQDQATQYLKNIKDALESNDLLKKDMGPFEEIDTEWSKDTIHIKKYDCIIQAVSKGQSIRGLRHKHIRPQLVILDDVDDLESTRTAEQREKTISWFFSDLMPIGDTNTRFIVIGNQLHESDLINTLETNIRLGVTKGKSKSYPIEQDGVSLWPGKYPNAEALDALKKKVGNEEVWQREYLLKITPRDTSPIRPEWIRTYTDLPKGKYQTVLAIDPAFSEKESADFTAMVIGRVFKDGEDVRIYISPRVNDRLTFNDSIEKAKKLSDNIESRSKIQILVETNGGQIALHQELKRALYPSEEWKSISDKRTRLVSISHLIEKGQVFFEEGTSKDLITQILNFGLEKHDDLMDACVMAINWCYTNALKSIGVHATDYYPRFWSPGQLDENGYMVEPTKQEMRDYYERANGYVDEGWL